MEIKLGIVDDHWIVTNGIQKILIDYPEISVTGTYANDEELLSGLEQVVPDVLLLDIQMPGKTGDKLVPIILKKYPELRIIALTNFDGIYYVRSVLRHGALGYLLKGAAVSMLIDAIKTVYEYNEFIDPIIKKQLDSTRLKEKRTSAMIGNLTSREKEVLQLITDGATYKEISESLHIAVDTAENYRFSLLLKFGVKNTAALVKKAVQLGYVE